MARLPFNFQSFDQEPRRSRHGPPPAYRSVSGSVTETDTWSDYSASSGLGKRRASWTNLVESDENLNKHKLNCYPKVRQINSAHPLPLKLAPPAPAGTLVPASATQSRAQSVATAPVAPPATSSHPFLKRNRLQEWKAACSRPCCSICLLLLALAIIAGIISAIVLTQVLKPPKTAQMSWLAPEMYRNGQNAPVRIEMKTDDDRIRLQMQGAIPFKGNYISYYDFKTNRVAVIDETLKGNGKSSTCFLLPLDLSNLRDADTMRYAIGNAARRSSQTQGWAESWQYLPSPLPMGTLQMFNPPIPECEGARWIQLEYVGNNQKSRRN
uniref:BRICHOS domain-containing protein n=1 Tax=Angiostrongylus cantonensis TaxID=6313 RepID=A0A158P8T6_ANGCA